MKKELETSDDAGPVGRLGGLAARHSGAVMVCWFLLIAGLAVLAPRAETALSGAGWEASGSESVQARALIDREFDGAGAYALTAVVRGGDAASARVARVLEADPAVRSVATVGASGGLTLIRAGAAKSDDEMVRAADDLKERVAAAAGPGGEAHLTGAPAMWSDFNAANKSAMAKSEMLSWPVTMTILLIAFGSLVAAGLPLLLTIASLIAAAGSLYLATLISPVSIWSMNFAMMFALALGIDYALFVVHRFRQLLARGGDRVRMVEQTMDTAGKAVLLSGLTVVVSLSAVMLIPSPAFRSTALGIILAVVFVLAAALTLLPAVLFRAGARINRFGLPRRRGSAQRNPKAANFVSAGPEGERSHDLADSDAAGPPARGYAAWAERVWRRPALFGSLALAVLVLLALPALGARTAMPSINVIPHGDHSRAGAELIAASQGPGAAAPLQIVAATSDAAAAAKTARTDRSIVAATDPATHNGYALIEATPRADASSPSTGEAIDRLRATLPPSALVGGSAAESHDLEAVLEHRAWLVIAVVLLLSFALLVFALRAPLIAAAAVLSNLLATAAAFGVARWAFQDGGLAGLLGFDAQGFLDAWAPVFFFAMAFAISMDYTVFLLATAKEHWDQTHDPKAAMVGGVAQSGRVILAAGSVMVAVFFTFALSGPLPPKEMGVILGVAVLLDTFLVRLLLMPVLMRLMGAAAWRVPRWIDRALPEVRFGHA